MTEIVKNDIFALFVAVSMATVNTQTDIWA